MPKFLQKFLKPIYFVGLVTFSASMGLAYSTPGEFEKSRSPLKLLVFLSHRCPCSMSHVNHLKELKSKFKDLQIYGVISEPVEKSNLALINKYFNQERFPFPIIRDDQQSLVKKYGALKTPHATLFKGAKVVYQGGVSSHRSFTPEAKKYIEENLLALSRGESVKYQRGQSLGCYIRRI